MNDLLQDLEAYFISTGHASDGNIFRDTMPDSPDTIIGLYEYAGVSGIPQIDSSTRNVQVLARDKNATAAKLKARALHTSLQTEDGIMNLTEQRWCTVSLKQTPFKIKIDDKNRIYYGFNVAFTTYND